MRERSGRGFTIVEMLTVLAALTVVALIAGASFRRRRIEQDVDFLAQAVHIAVHQARQRAVTTRTPYLLDLRRGSVQYCQVDPSTITTGPPAATTQTTCPPPTAGLEASPRAQAGPDAEIAAWAAGAEVRQAAGAVCGAPVSVSIGSGAPIYFGPGGGADESFASVMASGQPLSGVTVYLRRAAIDEQDKRRRVVIYGPSAQPRVIRGY